MKRFPIFSIILMGFALLGCFGLTELGSPQENEITHGYYTVSSIDQTIVSKQGKYLIYGVKDVDWNERYIVVKSLKYPARSNTDVFTWYIIDILNNQLYGPFSYDEYIQKREKLSVPAEIELLKPESSAWEVARRKQRERPQDTTSTYLPFVGGAILTGLLLIGIGIRISKKERRH
jgi:hypothetical protein